MSKSTKNREGKKEVNAESKGAIVMREKLFFRSYRLLNSATDALKQSKALGRGKVIN